MTVDVEVTEVDGADSEARETERLESTTTR
jgi:hypothetical protein